MRIQAFIGHLAIYASQKATLSLSTIRNHCTLVDHYTVRIDTDSHIRICICIDTDCIDTDCMSTDWIHTICINTYCINTDCMYTDCMYTDCINANCVTVDCIYANHVDTYNCDTIFCDRLDHAYEYARVMVSLDFDNVKLTKAQATYQAVYLQDFSWRQWRTR